MKSNERLREAVDQLKTDKSFTNEDLSTALGYRSKTYVSDILGGNKPINRLFLDRLKKYFGVNPDYIVDGKGNLIFESNELKNVFEVYSDKRLSNKNNAGPFMVPLVSVSVQAGYTHSYMDSDFIQHLDEYPIVPGIDPHGAIWRYFQVKGDSMLDFLNDGDYVLGSQIPKEDWADLKDFLVYVIVTDNLVTIKYAAKRKDEIILIPRNDKYEQIAIKFSDIKEIWKYRRHIGWNASNPKKMEIKI